MSDSALFIIGVNRMSDDSVLFSSLESLVFVFFPCSCMELNLLVSWGLVVLSSCIASAFGCLISSSHPSPPGQPASYSHQKEKRKRRSIITHQSFLISASPSQFEAKRALHYYCPPTQGSFSHHLHHPSSVQLLASEREEEEQEVYPLIKLSRHPQCHKL